MRTVRGVRNEESILFICRISQSNRQKPMPSSVVAVNGFVGQCYSKSLLLTSPEEKMPIPPGVNPSADKPKTVSSCPSVFEWLFLLICIQPQTFVTRTVCNNRWKLS